jgi:hypothetical protein
MEMIKLSSNINKYLLSERTVILLLFFISNFIFGQTPETIELNKEYPNFQIDSSINPVYKLHLEKGGLYQINVLQQGIDVKLVLANKNSIQILEKDSPNGQNGLETFEYSPQKTSIFFLIIKRLPEKGNPGKGKFTINIKRFTKSEIQSREDTKRELESENNKTVQTLDIDHFWEAFDRLKTCKTHFDSVQAFQKLYLDRATDGLIDFIKQRDFSAEKFVVAVNQFPKFYNAVRRNTYESKKAAPLIEEVFLKFKEIYPSFKPFKVCFAIGLISSGGTTSNSFVLIGAEVTTSTKDVDLSEFKANSFSKVLASEGIILQKIKNMVSHECVHTQQKKGLEKNAINCPLLYSVMHEGFCDFIGELVVGSQINIVAQEYGNNHEKELWEEFKNEMCSNDSKKWLYNYFTSKDRPADLGYFIGYKIAKEYYQNATDKNQAIINIIEMDDPLRFLEISRYDQKQKNSN